MFINHKIIKFLIIIFCFSISSSISQSNQDVPLKNLTINETPKPISSLIFEDFLGNKINIIDYYGKLVIINFWATWCAPCKKEMPSLDILYKDNRFSNLEILAVNMEEPNQLKTKIFFNNLNIKNLKIFFDPNLNFVKEFKLRGVPTTILVNKKEKSLLELLERSILWMKIF